MTVKELLEITDASLYCIIKEYNKKAGRFVVVWEDYADNILNSLDNSEYFNRTVYCISLKDNENAFYNSLVVYLYY